MRINPEHDRPLAEFLETDAGKAALSALMDYVGFNDLPEPMNEAEANYNLGMRAVVSRILMAYERVKNPGVDNPNPLGFQ